MTRLREGDFPAIFEEIHKSPPFRWQQRLLHEVIETGWPETIAAPTGTGKTAILDIALFHLALMPSGSVPRRIVFAVDRRIIVDQAFDRAKMLCDALTDPADERIAAMGDALRTLAGGDLPLHVEQLRGGMPREDEWARSPVQPTILCTTVDQLGSRLLFRGYGVSPSMAPVHAGLLGEDALLLMDEAHLSEPFRQTLDAVSRRRKAISASRPWFFCALTATPRPEAGSRFDLSPEEKAEPEISRRLAAAKTAELELCKAAAGSADHVAALVSEARSLAQQGTERALVIAIIVNRVALARDVLKALAADEADAILLTGRVRPIERERLIQKHEARLKSGRDPVQWDSPAAAPFFVVATQCIEAGADFDFDAMVSQIAPLDALRQRFGRLNRLGRRASGPAVIIAARDEIARSHDDPLYRCTLKTTWEWLSARVAAAAGRARPMLDISPQSFDAFTKADPEAADACVVGSRNAPVLRGADVHLLTITNPPPHPDPYLPLFLHGEASVETDVSIVWRADCEFPASLSEGASRGEIAGALADIIDAMPPVSGEALRVPLWAACKWLAEKGAEAAEITDAEAERPPEMAVSTDSSKLAFRWRGSDDKETGLVRAADLRPGDLIVVPASYGGCDDFGWAPATTRTVTDIADEAAKPYESRRYALRLHPKLWPEQDELSWRKAWADLQEYAAEENAKKLIGALLDVPQLPGPVRRAAELLEQVKPSPLLMCPYDPGSADGAPSGAILFAPRGIKPEETRPPRPQPSTEDDLEGSFADGSVSLGRHSEEVVRQAQAFAHALGLPAHLTATIAFAAHHHDAGKADERFQAWLRSEDTPTTEPIAKSGRWRGRAAELAARRAAGVPPSWRHEVLSVRIAAQHLAAASDSIDGALALYLVGTHHGHGRPFFPHHDPWDTYAREIGGREIPVVPGPERLDFDWNGQDWAGLCALLQQQYGPWGLAFLEAVLRLADHRVSEAGS